MIYVFFLKACFFVPFPIFRFIPSTLFYGFRVVTVLVHCRVVTLTLYYLLLVKNQK
jgi:hypothetical protein